MTLLTPPSTVLRVLVDKENIPDNVFDDVHGGSRVVWSQKNSYHSLSSLPSASASSTKSNKFLPTKSILKPHVQSSIFLLPFPAEPEPRQVTPEPADPLTDLNYLVYPLSQIVKHASDVSMRELIEAYNVLAARLRTSVVGKHDIDASWPLFEPLRKNRKAFVYALVRDLGRALINPASGDDAENMPRVLLPSPKGTPKKKGGMTAEQVKYARDLCTTCHSVIRLLALVFTLPALRNLFSVAELSSIFTALLAIPIADDLPTPNARKTCALAIWLLQCQRLPSTVLLPAKDRIAIALRRGIDGELGKEGKKGSTSDGLKAIHDLSISYPAIFVPTFAATLLPSILSSLLAPTLALRTQACHALGGFVMGLISLPRSKLHTRVSHTVAAFLTTPPPPKNPSPASSSTLTTNLFPSKSTVSPSSSASPTKPTSSPILIINTLRTTLQAEDPAHVAAGPVWAHSVLACLLVMLSSALTEDANTKLTRVVSVLLGLAMKHSRSSVRAVGCLMWRCVIWVYFQDRLPPLEDSEGESEVEDGVEKNATRSAGKAKEMWWMLVTNVVELNTGVCTIAALLNSSSDEDREDSDVDVDEPLQRTLEILHYMVRKTNRQVVVDGLETLKRLLGVPTSNLVEQVDQDEDPEKGECQWEPTTKLLPHSLFSSLPGLLSVEFKALSSAVRPVFEETAGPEDVRPLTRGEVARGSAQPDDCLDLDVGNVDDHNENEKSDEKGSWWMWEGLVRAWRGCVMRLWEGDWAGVAIGNRGETELEGEKEATRNSLVSVWEALVGVGVGFLQDAGDDEATSVFAVRVIKVLTNIFQDAPLGLLQPKSSPSTPECKLKHGKSSPVPLKLAINASSVSSCSTSLDSTTKLALVERLWHATSMLIPHQLLASSGAPERLLACLMKREDSLTFPSSLFSLPSAEEEEQETAHLREQWTKLCVDVLVKCNPEALRAFWGYVNSDGEREWEWGWDGKERARVWRWFVDRWVGAWENGVGGVGWEGAVVLLGVPFLDKNAWVMSEEDLTRWQNLLEYATAQALDEGQDEAHSHSVLSALATSIASHNTSILFGTSSSPTSSNSNVPVNTLSSPSIRLADLLLTSLASSFASDSCVQLPQSVLEFVNDAMRESYPPLPRDTMVFLWTARAVTGAVEACPRELIGSFLGEQGGVGEGVGMWIADECKAWNVGELGYDIIPLYQHILTRIQELPLTLSTLRTFASIIASPFVGRVDMPQAAKDAFREFWEATYAVMRKPREEWPEEVEMCLRAVFGNIEDKAVEETVIDPALSPAFKAVSVSTSPMAREAVSAPVTPTKTTSASSSANTMSIANEPQQCTPIRPDKVNFYTHFPLRSPKSPVPSLVPAEFSPSSHSFPGAIPLPALSVPPAEVPSPSSVARARSPSPGPSTPRKARMRLDSMSPDIFKSMHVPSSTPKHVPTTPKRSAGYDSPAKRRKIGDKEEEKENKSPSTRQLIRPSFIVATGDEERERVVKPFALGKRARKEESGGSEEMSPQKKGRVRIREPGDSADEKIVKNLLIPDPDDSFIATPPAPAKRKRVFMDAVEVPRLKDVYPQLRSTPSLNELRTPSYACSPSYQKRQTRGVTNPLVTYVARSSRKRSRASAEDDVFSVSTTFSALDDSELEIPFSDSFTLDKPPASPKELPPSDDDPHIGQVTPHCLISPVPRRSTGAKFCETDPPSDDSVMGEYASPSKDVVERKLKRLGSMTNVTTMPHGMVARMKMKPAGV